MANVDAPSGFRPAFHLAGGVIRPQKYAIASGLNNAIGYGDMVIRVNTNKNVDAMDATSDVPILGSFAGCYYRNSAGEHIFSRNWVAATTTLGSAAAVAYVYDDPWIVYEVQVATGSTVIAVTEIGQMVDLSYAEPNATTGMSNAEVTYAAGSEDNFMIYDIVPRDDNEANAAHTKVWVTINRHPWLNAGAANMTEI